MSDYMSEKKEIRFIRGDSSLYLKHKDDLYKDCVFFGTNDHRIYVNGDIYGSEIKTFVKDIEYSNDSRHIIKITYVDGSKETLFIPLTKVIESVLQDKDYIKRLESVEKQLTWKEV